MNEDEMKSGLAKLEEAFEKYRMEVVRLESITDAFESTCKQLTARNELLEQLVRKTKTLIEAEEYGRLKDLYRGMIL